MYKKRNFNSNEKRIFIEMAVLEVEIKKYFIFLQKNKNLFKSSKFWSFSMQTLYRSKIKKNEVEIINTD